MIPHRKALSSDGPAGNSAHAHSSIPVPPSARKQVARGGAAFSSRPSISAHSVQSRPSLAPHSSMGPPRPYELKGGRGSTLHARPELSSGLRGDAGFYGRTPQASRNLPHNARRSSVVASAGGARASIMPGFGTTSRDPRPIRERSFQNDCLNNVQEFLSRHKFPMLSPRPTQKDIEAVFRFLADELVGPGLPWSKKFEDDCSSILKDLRYPSLDAIGRSALGVAGSERNWPLILAMFSWMVDLCKAQEDWTTTDVVADPLLRPASELPVDHPRLEDRLLWDYCSRSYQEWCNGAETFPQAERELQEAYDRIMAASVEECEKLEADIRKRDAELRQLRAQEPPLRQNEEEYARLTSDRTKFIAFLELHRQRVAKIKQQIQLTLAAKEENQRNIATARAELVDAEAAVAAQNLSPDEVNRMNHEKEALARNLDELREKIAEATHQGYDQEMLVTKAMDRLEQLLQDYTTLGHQIGIISSSFDSGYSEQQDTDFTIDLDLGAEGLNSLRDRGRQCMQVIRPALQSYCERFRKEVRDLQDDAIALEDERDCLVQDVERQREDVARREMRFKIVSDQAEDAKNRLQTETVDTNRTVSKLESEVSAMSSASQQGVFSTQSQLESAKIELQELQHRTTEIQQSVVTQLMGHVDTLIQAKEHTAHSLKGVRNFAETQ